MIKLSLATIFGLLAISLTSFAGDKPEMKPATAPALTVDGNVFFTDSNGKHALDPMCGMQVTVDAKTAIADHDGKHYYFCNPGCSKAFSANPTESLAKLALPIGVTAMSGSKMMVNCAVSSERIAVNDKTAHQAYKGRDYFFCCNKCPVAFAKNPEKYATAMAAAEAKAALEAKEHNNHEGHSH